ncbi:glycosyltransferase [Phenylobacterium sp. LjRoot225]|uniref:hypothetical protein n=1 Tax=Phenylobacterium sp. LjRoot225 TaxID=3342285 RepID=UPI003ECEC5FB
MEFEYRRPDVEQALLSAKDVASLEAALTATAGLKADLDDPAIRGHQMFSPGLDAAIPTVARRLDLHDVPLTKTNDRICIVATRLYEFGGHSKVASDIAAIVGPGDTTVVYTDIDRELRHQNLLNLRRTPADNRHRADLLLGANTLVGKILELYNLMAAVRPGRIFLLTHHFDMVALIALWPFRSVVEYLHHADHLPTLGATLPWSAHADLTWGCHTTCQRAGLNPTYVGLTVTPTALTTPSTTGGKTPDRLRIATCGHSAKYRGAGTYRWLDFAVAALQRPGAEIVHFGDAEDAFQREIRQGLAEAGVDPAAYVFAGLTPGLAEDLRAREVDVYLSSYPVSGGKAIVEAMSAGLPPIVPLDPDCPPLLRFDFPTDIWVEVSRPQDINGAIDAALAKRAAMAGAGDPIAAEVERFNAYVRTPPAATPPAAR